jgi:hypothetical protein
MLFSRRIKFRRLVKSLYRRFPLIEMRFGNSNY